MSTDTAVASEPLVLSSREGGVVRLRLNRGNRFNPLSLEMIAAIQAELDAIAGDPEARVVVLAAEGRGFSAGHDLKEMRAHAGDEAWQRRLFDDCSRMMLALTRLPQPVIARVHGIATAAGCQLVSMCDLAVAADTATFATPRRQHRRLLLDAGGRRGPQHRPQARDGDAADRRADRRAHRPAPGVSSTASCRPPSSTPPSRTLPTSFSRAVPPSSASGRRAFYRQIEQPLEPAYDARRRRDGQEPDASRRRGRHRRLPRQAPGSLGLEPLLSFQEGDRRSGHRRARSASIARRRSGPRASWRAGRVRG